MKGKFSTKRATFYVVLAVIRQVDGTLTQTYVHARVAHNDLGVVISLRFSNSFAAGVSTQKLRGGYGLFSALIKQTLDAKGHLADVIVVVDANLLPAEAVHVANARTAGIRLNRHHLGKTMFVRNTCLMQL